MSGRTRRGRPPHNDVLTPSEWRVVHAVQHGMSNREIAARRGISLDAVKYHVANAVAKLGLTNRQALRRWFRVPGTSALRRQERPIMTTMTLGPLAQIARTVRDIKESEAWYGGPLGLPHQYSFGSLAFFDCGGTRLMLSAQEKPVSESILYLRVGDIRAAYDLMRSRRGQFLDAPHLTHAPAVGPWQALDPLHRPESRP